MPVTGSRYDVTSGTGNVYDVMLLLRKRCYAQWYIGGLVHPPKGKQRLLLIRVVPLYRYIGSSVFRQAHRHGVKDLVATTQRYVCS